MPNSDMTTRYVDGVAVHTISANADDPAKLASGKGVKDGDVIVTADVVAIRVGKLPCALHACQLAGFAELDMTAGDTWRTALGGRYAAAYTVAEAVHAGKPVRTRRAALQAVPDTPADDAPAPAERRRAGARKGDPRAAVLALVDSAPVEDAPPAPPRSTRRRRPASATSASVAPVTFISAEGGQ